MRKRSSPERRWTVGARLLVLCTLAVFVAGMSAAFAADAQTAAKGGSKAPNAPAGDVMLSVPGLNGLVLDLPGPPAAPGGGPESLLVGCPTTTLVGGQGTSGNGRAPHSNFLFIRTHYLITPAEMAASGFPSGAAPAEIGWMYTTGSGVAPTGALTIYLENTADTTNLKSTTWATAIATMTPVHNASTTLPATAGSFNVPFVGGSPFTYTGGGLYVAFDWSWAGPNTTTAVVDCNTSLTNGLKGAQSNAAAPTAVAASNFRPATRLTPDVGAANDVSVDLVRALGVLPTPLVGPQIFSAVVSNKGTNAQANVPVTMAITGVDSFFDVFTVPALPACTGTATATFAAFTPAAIGPNTISVSVPADDFAGNNLLTKSLDETNNRYSYKHPGSTASGGVGFNGGSGAFVAAFSITEAADVSEVELEFFAVSATTYRVAIYPDVAGGPGTTALYLDAADRTVAAAGPVVITLPTPVAVGPGRFYVGIQQTNTTNASLSFDTENPLRTDTFYVAGALPVLGWTDFAPANTFKLNIGVKLIQCSVTADCNDSNVCTDEVCVNELCVYTNNTATCDDANPCTGPPDTCAGGVCVPGPNPCEDNNACTTDVCDGMGGCTYPPVVCNDNNPCTTDSCIPATGCDFAPTTGPACTDNNVCTIGDTCQAGVCVPGPLPPATQFCNTASVTIPSSGPASTYPMPITVSGLGSVCKVTLSINGIFHTWPADLDVLLSAPGGLNSIVMSDVGSNVAIASPGVTLTFDDAAANSLTTAALVTGTYKPTNRGTGDVWAAPAPVPIGGTALSIYNGIAPTGNWNLWVVDQFAGDTGGISGGWCINIVGSPCVTDADCNDSNACNGAETCNAGTCQSGTPIVCDDGLFCTLDSCTTATGACVFAPNPCADGDLCTTDACDEAGDTCVYTNGCVQVCSTAPITIPPGGAATPYPSPIVVTGVTYPAVLASVELQGFSHIFPDDVDILLEGPVDPSFNIKLMSDAGGGTPAVGLNLKFADGAPAISNTGPLVSGTFSPADYTGGTDGFPAPAPAWSGNLLLSTFNGNPNGTFNLYVLDEFTPDDGSIVGWCLNILPIGCTDVSECDDGNFCTADSCENGTCVNTFSTSVCDDLNPCTTETCSPADGCGYLPFTCDDGLLCTTDSCTDFVGCNFVPIVCNDGNPNTTDSCDPATGTCVFIPTGCDDGNACTTDAFDPGSMQCVYTPIVCNDSNACTTDSCNPATGCVFTPIVCDDSNACTTDSCAPATGCVYTPIVCDDSNACTTDSCAPATGCVFTPITCDDGNACTTDSCDPMTGCVYTPITCDDGNACTTDSCDPATGCVSTPIVCNDGNLCTTDTCDPATGCVYTPITCDDGNLCTNDVCDPATGTCGSTAIFCDDFNGCTDDVCDPAVGCVYTNNNISCFDGDLCTDNDRCVNGACQRGTPIVCVSYDQCRAAGVCEPATGLCTNPPLPDGTACNDHSVCTSDDVCVAGVCTGEDTPSRTPTPRTKGFYKKYCRDGWLTEGEAQCVAQVAPLTFPTLDTVAEVCDSLNGHDTDTSHDSDQKQCNKSDDELLVLALNICGLRLCTNQPIDSNYSDNTTVGESLAEADMIFGDAGSSKDECKDAEKICKEINNGKAIDLSGLVLDKVAGGGVRLLWTPPYLVDGQTVDHYEVWRRVRGTDNFQLIETLSTTTYTDFSPGDFDYEVTVEIRN